MMMIDSFLIHDNGQWGNFAMEDILLLGLTQHTLGKLGNALGELGSTAVGADNNHVQGM